MMHSTSHKLDAAAFRTFLFQGKALFTLENKEKNTHITFRVQSPKRRRGTPEDLRFFDVHVKALNDQYHGSRFIGRIDRKLKSFKPRGFSSTEDVGIQTINWIIRHWENLEHFVQEDKLGIYHMGTCCKCGLPLTVPESIQNGIGPQCFKYREGKSIEILKESGLYKTGVAYADMVMEALDARPDLFDQIFIPDIVRRSSDWFQKMSTYADFGLV